MNPVKFQIIQRQKSIFFETLACLKDFEAISQEDLKNIYKTLLERIEAKEREKQWQEEDGKNIMKLTST